MATMDIFVKKAQKLGERPLYEINWIIVCCVHDFTPFFRVIKISRSSLKIDKREDSKSYITWTI